MSDIFREVDEEVRSEQYSRLWKRFSPFVYVTAGLIIAGTAGFKGYEYWETNRSQEAGQTFMNSVELSDQGKHDEALGELAGLSDAIGGYPMLAELRSAAEIAKQGKVDEAVAAYDAVAAKNGVTPVFRGLAQIRAAYLLLDTKSLDEVTARVEPLTMAGNAWRFAALEILGAANYKAGKLDTARQKFTEITNDAGAPGDVAGRASVYLSLIEGVQGTTEEGNSQ